MSGTEDGGSRRLELVLRRPALHLLPGVRPTVVVGGRGQPAQWGVGTWMIPAGADVEIAVYVFNRIWRFGEATVVIGPKDVRAAYRAPALPWGRGRFELDAA
ncbi:MAG: hypothetical protein PGN24_04610 [Microbacterium arborescens]